MSNTVLFSPASLVSIRSDNDAVLSEEVPERSGVSLASITWSKSVSLRSVVTVLNLSNREDGRQQELSAQQR